MNLYAESSALLSWLLGEADATRVSHALGGAEGVAVSDLVILECERAFIRMLTLGMIDKAAHSDLQVRLHAALGHWSRWRISPEIIERARHPFPGEPIRTLDALHLAAALAVRSVVPGLELLSLDDRIRRAGEQLGFKLQPT